VRLARTPAPESGVLAAVLNTSISTIQKWEAGDKKPSGPFLTLLNLIERKGLEAVL
jgi:putative transcriptional regulator